MPLSCSVIVCAHNEARYLAACLHTLLAQSRPPDEVIVIDNASTDGTGAIAAAMPGVRVVAEHRKGLVVARETGRLAATGDILVYVDADCRAPLTWLARIERRFLASPDLVALTGPYRYYDWDWQGRLLIRCYDLLVAPPTQTIVKYVMRIGTLFYGGNFAVRREALARIGGFDTAIEFHGEDTNVGRRLAAVGPVSIYMDCWIHTSARRFIAMGRWAVVQLYVRNFLSEVLHHRPSDTTHVDVRM